MESFRAIEPNAAALGQAAPQQGASGQRVQPVEMLDGGPPAGSLALESAPHPPQEGVQEHVQTAALETPNRPRDAVVISESVSENAVGRSGEVLFTGTYAARLNFEPLPQDAPGGPSVRARVAAPQTPSKPRGDVVSSAILVYCQGDFMKEGFKKAVCVQNSVKRTTLHSAIAKLNGDHQMREVKKAAVAARDPKSDDHAELLLELSPFKEFWPEVLSNPGAAKLHPKSRANGAQNYLGSGVKQSDYIRVFDEMVGSQTRNLQP
ncbi:hypothetical protein T484DRAFT_1816386 [Baffinella frigidus]|nr:hypothetical protein T484DRAFT_1816386 [Cryptophyta sp. CCMP2293]